MTGLFLVATLDGQRIALASEWVDSVVHVTSIVPVPLAPRHVIGLAALRSRVITLIDARAALGLDAGPPPPVLITIVLVVDGHQYGLVVDHVEDVCAIAGQPAPLRARIGRGWADAAIGVLDHADGSVLLLDPAALIAGPARAAA